MNDPHQDTPVHTNRLAHATSPYLLQHAHNPVDWHPWGDAAFEKARRENKPIFLSVGYSTCHWCHVMAHESFEDEAVAAVLNASFVAIKADREELPDVDNQYMLATQAFYVLNGVHRSGGWPNSVWLMPDGRPFYAGTYFPKEQFVSLLENITALYRDRPDEVERYASVMSETLEEMGRLQQHGSVTIDRALLDRAIREVTAAYDATHGGFGSRPKFPPHATLDLLFADHDRAPNERYRVMITGTLDAMRRGGIYDHIGGGFHRYATDERWFLPHFEKMLYDNAQLIRAYTDGYRLTGDQRYERVVAETFDWLTREMTDEGGAFYSAIDADSEGEEGRFYVWGHEEIIEVLGTEDATLFSAVYGVLPEGNFHEEATGRRMSTNIPYLTCDPNDAEHQHLAGLRAKLLEQRNTRIRPHLDNKIITAWNALTIGSLAHAGRHLGQPRYVEAAARAADFILQALRDKDGGLLRTYRAGDARLPAYLDDYAYLIEALLDLHDATNDPDWIGEARKLADTMLSRFGDPAGGGFFYTTGDHDARIICSKNPNSGGNLPHPNGVAARALLTLGERTGDDRFTRAGLATLDAFAFAVKEQPHAAGELLAAATKHIESLEAYTSQTSTAGQPVTITAQLDSSRVSVGDTFTVTLRMEIAPPYHIYANEPSSGDVVATRVALAEGEGVELIDVVYPEAQPKENPVLNKTLGVYEGSVDIVVQLRAKRSGPFALAVTTQACDDHACQLATTHRVRLSVEIDR